MMKQLFILFNTISLVLLGIFTSDSVVKITNNLPDKMLAGKEYVVEFKLVKPSIQGFGMFQIELPNGVSLVQNPDSAVSFVVEGNIVKWVWASLPSDDEVPFNIHFRLASNLQGNVSFKSRFYYIYDNEKAFVDMSPKQVEIENAEMTKAFENAAKDTGLVSAPAAVASNAEPPGNIVLNRTVIKGSKPGEIIVTVKIRKGVTKGFARFSDDVKQGIMAKVLKADGSSFSVADGKLKFVWVAVPDKEELEISYSLSSSTEKTTDLHGEYSYLEDNQSKKVNMNELKAEFTDLTNVPEVAASPEKQTTKESPPVAAAEPVKESAPEPLKVTEKVAEKPVSTPKPTPSIPVRKDGSVTYHVQIGAFKNTAVTAALLKKMYHIKENIRSEFHESLSKFMIGEHDEYKGARDHREEAKRTNGVSNAFVVAYNEGKRITVQEALMITNQKWFK
jgi:cell division septation protein DedD